MSDPAETDPAETESVRLQPVRRWASRLLIALGALCLALWAAAWAEGRWTEAVEGRRLEAALASPAAANAAAGEATADGAPAAESTATAEAPAAPFEPGALIGRIEIPRVEVSAIVLAGVEARVLRRAVGHVPGTALPGGGGNVALAGHRDRHFAGLRDVAPGDEVVLTTLDGVHRYRIAATQVVDPHQIEVLADRGREELTLITCFPFRHIGPAPRRFIVHADPVAE